MKNTKRMLAVIAASGLALGAMPGVANAQGSEDLLDLNLNLGLGDSLGLGVELGLGSLGIDPTELDPIEFPELSGSLADLQGATGSDDLAAGSDNLEGAIGEIADAGSAGGNGSSSQGSNDQGSNGDEGDDNSGSSQGSNQEGSNNQGSNNGTDGQLSSGSLTPNPGTGDGDDEEEDAPGFLGSLEDIFSGSSEAGSDNGSGSDEGTEDDDEVPGDDEDEDAPTFGSGDINVNGSLGTEEIMMLGSLAGAGIAVGLAVQGGVTLPPLPEVNLGFVCQLPQEGIDFLKNNGSMERDECEPEDQQN